MKSRHTSTHGGFAIPIVFIVGSTLIVLLLAILQTVASLSTYTRHQYYTKLAEEAAEAGLTYASACLKVNNRAVTWGNTASTYLTQTSNCAGNQSTYPSNSVVANDDIVTTRFEVGAPDYSSSDSIQLSAKGFAEIKIAGSSVIVKTYTQSLKKTITWDVQLTGTRSVSGAYRTCGILSGSVYCWGRNAVGQLGNGTHSATQTNPNNPAADVDTRVPVRVVRETGVLAGKKVVDIFSAAYHNCVLTDEGKVYCWGYNNNGQLGDGTRTNRDKPVEVKGALEGKVVTAIGGTGYSSCAIAENKIYCWGDNDQGTVGIGTTSSYVTTPTLVSAGGSGRLPSNYAATKLSSSGSLSLTMCAIADGKAYCWGVNSSGQIGDGSTTRRLEPRAVSTSGVLAGRTVTDISQDGTFDDGVGHTCAVANSLAYCWGDNNAYGMLGNNSTTRSTTPVAVSTSGVLSGKNITSIAIGIYHSCVLTSEAKVACWGYNAWGQVGNNTTTNSRIPVAIYEEANRLQGQIVVNLGAGANRGCATIAAGRTYCWGVNTSGQIGDNTLDNRSKPTESIFLRQKNNEFIY